MIAKEVGWERANTTISPTICPEINLTLIREMREGVVVSALGTCQGFIDLPLPIQPAPLKLETSKKTWAAQQNLGLPNKAWDFQTRLRRSDFSQI